MLLRQAEQVTRPHAGCLQERLVIALVLEHLVHDGLMLTCYSNLALFLTVLSRRVLRPGNSGAGILEEEPPRRKLHIISQSSPATCRHDSSRPGRTPSPAQGMSLRATWQQSSNVFQGQGTHCLNPKPLPSWWRRTVNKSAVVCLPCRKSRTAHRKFRWLQRQRPRVWPVHATSPHEAEALQSPALRSGPSVGVGSPQRPCFRHYLHARL